MGVVRSGWHFGGGGAEFHVYSKRNARHRIFKGYKYFYGGIIKKKKEKVVKNRRRKNDGSGYDGGGGGSKFKILPGGRHPSYATVLIE